TTTASAAESDIHDSDVLVAPAEVIQKPLRFVSVEDACMANWVVGVDVGFPFASFAKSRVEVVAPDIVGVPGVAAVVYASEEAEAEPVLERASLEVTV
ncbi:MAG: hypothetical protein Q8Q08_00025, partial [Candidatus Omnitrophota bacterium]|nr:hypothetical protein [Candidatus Omnitrophota bacterium]